MLPKTDRPTCSVVLPCEASGRSLPCIWSGCDDRIPPSSDPKSVHASGRAKDVYGVTFVFNTATGLHTYTSRVVDNAQIGHWIENIYLKLIIAVELLP